MELPYTSVQRQASLMSDRARGFGVAIGLGLLLTAYSLAAVSRQHSQTPVRLAGQINPNTASVASLARLPGIGLTRASAIVAYRTRFREETGQEIAFGSPADLERVKGVGPHTAGQMATWLVFGASADNLPKRDIAAN